MNFLLIGTGGALGAISRYALTEAVTKYFATSQYIGTLSVNILGCFLVGLLFGLFADMKSEMQVFFCYRFSRFIYYYVSFFFSNLRNV
jgi:CrcB protein